MQCLQVILFLMSLSDVVVRHQLEIGLIAFADEPYNVSRVQNYDDEEVYKLVSGSLLCFVFSTSVGSRT